MPISDTRNSLLADPTALYRNSTKERNVIWNTTHIPNGNESESFCNLTAYNEWHSSPYDFRDDGNGPAALPTHELRLGLLVATRSDERVWSAMNFDSDRETFVSNYGGRRPKPLALTNGQVMEISAAWCLDLIDDDLHLGLAGGHGPPTDADVRDVMCDGYCLASDALREEALRTGRCDCLELSLSSMVTTTSPFVGDVAYDWCRTNSASMLCARLSPTRRRRNLARGVMFSSVCDNLKSQCLANDFQCPRERYDEVEGPLNERGNECNGGGFGVHPPRDFWVSLIPLLCSLLQR